MIKTITKTHGKDFSEAEKYFIENLAFVLEKNKEYTITEALEETKKYFNHEKLTAIFETIQKDTELYKNSSQITQSINLSFLSKENNIKLYLKNADNKYKEIATINNGIAIIDEKYQHIPKILEYALESGAENFKHYTPKNKFETANYKFEINKLKNNREKLNRIKNDNPSEEKKIDTNIKNIANMASNGFGFWAYEYRHWMRDLIPSSAREIIKEKFLKAELVLHEVSDKHEEIMREVIGYGIHNRLNDFEEKTFLNNVPEKYNDIIIMGMREWADDYCEDEKDAEYFKIVKIVKEKIGIDINKSEIETKLPTVEDCLKDYKPQTQDLKL